MTFKKFYNGLINATGQEKSVFSFIFVLLVWVFYAKWVYMFREIKTRKHHKNYMKNYKNMEGQK